MFRIDSKFLEGILFLEDPSLQSVVHGHIRSDELVEILVSAQDEYLISGVVFQSADKCPDDIVGLVSLLTHRIDPECTEKLLNEGFLGFELARHLVPRSFVFGVNLFPKILPLMIQDEDEIVRLIFRMPPEDHLCESENGVHRSSILQCEGGNRVEQPIDEIVPIDEIDLLLVHTVSVSIPR